MSIYHRIREYVFTTPREKETLRIARREQPVPPLCSADALYSKAESKGHAVSELERELQQNPQLDTPELRTTLTQLRNEKRSLEQRAWQLPKDEYQRWVNEATAIENSIPERELDGQAIRYNLGLYAQALLCYVIFTPMSLGGVSYRPDIETKPIFRQRKASNGELEARPTQ